VSYWLRDAERPHYVGDNYSSIIDDGEYMEIDAILAAGLLSHLKAEFKEFSSIHDWRGLVRRDIPKNAVLAMKKQRNSSHTLSRLR